MTKRKYDTGDGERREERESAIIGKGIEQFSESLQCLKTEKRATLIFFFGQQNKKTNLSVLTFYR